MSGVLRAGGGAGTRDIRAVARSVDILRGQLAAVQSAMPPVGLTPGDVQALIASSLAAVEAPVVAEPLTFEQGTYAFDGAETFYISFGSDGNWEAIEETTLTRKTTGAFQAGAKPTTTVEFTSKTYSDADPI